MVAPNFPQLAAFCLPFLSASASLQAPPLIVLSISPVLKPLEYFPPPNLAFSPLLALSEGMKRQGSLVLPSDVVPECGDGLLAEGEPLVLSKLLNGDFPPLLSL